MFCDTGNEVKFRSVSINVLLAAALLSITVLSAFTFERWSPVVGSETQGPAKPSVALRPYRKGVPTAPG